MPAANRNRTDDRNGFEYKITYPTSTSSAAVQPVVFFLGWLGSKDRTLAKYSSIYENEECITIRYIHPTQAAFLTDPNDSDSYREASVKLVQLLEEHELLTNPVIVHLFSNGGFFVYRYFSYELEKRNINVAGAVFDSCPAELHWNIAVRSMYIAFPSKFIFVIVAILFSFMYIFKFFQYTFGCKTKGMYKTMQDATEHQWPHLYLYSSADALVPLRHVEKMAAARMKAGVSVKMHNFQTSAHVTHFKDFPDEYRKLCIEFMRNCLSTSNSPQL